MLALLAFSRKRRTFPIGRISFLVLWPPLRHLLLPGRAFRPHMGQVLCKLLKECVSVGWEVRICTCERERGRRSRVLALCTHTYLATSFLRTEVREVVDCRRGYSSRTHNFLRDRSRENCEAGFSERIQGFSTHNPKLAMCHPRK